MSVRRPRDQTLFDEEDVFLHYEEYRRSGVASANNVMEEPAMWRSMGPVAGQAVLDLGCGAGYFGRQLLEHGCSTYVGVDASRKMVQAARELLRGHSGATILLGDLERPHEIRLPSIRFDIVVSRLALHYIHDLDRLMRWCAVILGMGGKLLITVLHPVITSCDGRDDSRQARTNWVVDGYFAEGPRPRAWMGSTAIWYHRTIEGYCQSAIKANFRVTDLRECEPDPEAFGTRGEELARRRRVPLFLLLRFEREAVDG